MKNFIICLLAFFFINEGNAQEYYPVSTKKTTAGL